MSGTLGTYQGLPCHHWEEELPLIVDVLSAVKPKLVVETGTMYGGFAAFLADTVKVWDGIVLTVDHIIYPGLEDALTGRANLHFFRTDILGDLAEHVIYEQVEEADHHRDFTCFYADGPVRRPEFAEFAHLFNLAAVHDYGTEVTPQQMERWAAECDYVPFQHEPFAKLQEQKGGYFVSRFWMQQAVYASGR